jgi:hypothetical protein
MKKTMTTRTLFKGIGVLLVLYFLVELFRIAGNKETRLKVVDTIPVNYLDLFTKKDTSITDRGSYILYKTNISPFSDFNYEQKYWIVITKLRALNNKTVLPVIDAKSGNANVTEEAIYTGFKKGYFEVDFLPDSTRVSNVHLILDGDSVKTIIKNDSIASYYFKMKKLSVGYKDEVTKNIYMTNTDNPIPSMVCFLIYKKSTYFVFISALSSNNKLELNDVYNILKLKR